MSNENYVTVVGAIATTHVIPVDPSALPVKRSNRPASNSWLVGSLTGLSMTPAVALSLRSWMLRSDKKMMASSASSRRW